MKAHSNNILVFFCIVLCGLQNVQSAVKEVPMLHLGENECLVNMKTILTDLYFGKLFGDSCTCILFLFEQHSSSESGQSNKC